MLKFYWFKNRNQSNIFRFSGNFTQINFVSRWATRTSRLNKSTD